jgi:hypothetical protein
LQLFFDSIGQGTWATDLQVSPGQSQNIGIALRVDSAKFKQPFPWRWDTKDDKRLTRSLSTLVVTISKSSITLKDDRFSRDQPPLKERPSVFLASIFEE